MTFTSSDPEVDVGAINEFANETTLHGLPRVLKPSNSYKRSVWFVLFTCSVVILTWQAYELVNQFLSFKTTVSTNVEQSAIPFPAVTICNENGASVATREDIAKHIEGYDALDAFRNPNYNVYNNLSINTFNQSKCPSNETCEFRQAYLKWFGNVIKMLTSNYQENYRLDSYFLAANLGLNVSALAGIRLQDFVYVCKFDGERCNMNDFVVYHHSRYLLCHTYKTDKFARVGRNRGLNLVLKYASPSPLLKKFSLLPGISKADISPGFRVSVHPQNEPPSLDDGGQVFFPGVRASLAFTKTTYSRLSKPYGNCTNRATLRNSDTIYSPIGCTGEYQQEVIRDMCNCTDISLPYKVNDVIQYPHCRKLDLPNECTSNASFWRNINRYNRNNLALFPAICSVEIRRFYDRLDCMVNASNVAYRRTTQENIDLGCYPSCDQLKYDVRDTSNIWPSGDGFFQTIGRLAADNLNSRSSEMISYMIQWAENESTLDDFRSKFLQINVNLKDADVIRNSEEALYNWYQLLSEFGGLMGLYIGMSVMTLCEMFEVLFIKLWRLMSSQTNRWTKTKIQVLK